jgi:ADP-ribose pyrophosphatase YjhB (NUDIX family)
LEKIMASIIDHTWYTRIPSARERNASGGVVVRKQGKKLLVAFAREANFPQFVLPKGGVDRGETLEEAAIREVGEEVGITDLKLIRTLGVRQRLSFDKTRWQIVHYFLFLTGQAQGTPLDSRKHVGMWWFPIDELPEMLWPEQKELIETERDAIIKDIGAFSNEYLF